jgi:peptidoglycan/LPS O-acetylase OafA/YrhL
MSEPRNLSIDLIKLLAAFGVIVIHLAPSTPDAEMFSQLFWPWVVPFFLLISLYFFINKVNRLAVFSWSELHLDRILVPYAVWSVFYTLMRLVKLHLAAKPFSVDPISLIFYGGGATQLYFLPLLLLFQAVALAIIFLRRGPKWQLLAAGLLLGTIVWGYFGATKEYLGFDHPVERALMYVALVYLLVRTQASATGRRINCVFGGIIILAIVSTAFFHYPLNLLRIAEGPVVSYGVAALVLNWRLQMTSPVLRSLVTFSYGIYLAHFAFVEVFEFIAPKMGISLLPYTVSSKLLMAGLIFLCCVGFILFVRRYSLSSYLLLGEEGRASRPSVWARETGAVTPN